MKSTGFKENSLLKNQPSSLSLRAIVAVPLAWLPYKGPPIALLGNMSLLPYFVIWSGLAIGVLGLALYRYLVSMHEDDFLHLGAGGEKLIPEQIATYDKLGGLDRTGKRLTAITLGLGVLLLIAYLYRLVQGLA